MCKHSPCADLAACPLVTLVLYLMANACVCMSSTAFVNHSVASAPPLASFTPMIQIMVIT